MSTTARLSLPYIAPQQAQKQVTYNAAMALLDQLVQPTVKSRTTAAPPGSPAEGDTYIVAPAATGQAARVRPPVGRADPQRADTADDHAASDCGRGRVQPRRRACRADNASGYCRVKLRH